MTYNAEWDRRVEEIRARAASGLAAEGKVEYGAYEKDADELPVDNLDRVAVKGVCRLVQAHDPYWGQGADYRSDLVLDPTWKMVFVLANEMVRVTGDLQHVFLEGVTVLREEDGVKIVEFDMGS